MKELKTCKAEDCENKVYTTFSKCDICRSKKRRMKTKTHDERTRIKYISEKKQARLRETGGEAKLFKEIWEERIHRSELSGDIISYPATYCFAHLLAKGMYPEYRMNKNNIALVKDIDEHLEVDKLTIGNKMIIQNMLKEGKTSLEIIKYLKGL